MKRTFEKLQNQHPAVRTRVALTIAAVVTGAIGLVLLTTLPLRFEDTTALTASSNSASVLDAASSAAAPQVQNLQDGWTSLTDGLQVNQGGASTIGDTSVPQDGSQNAGFPADAAQTNTETY